MNVDLWISWLCLVWRKLLIVKWQVLVRVIPLISVPRSTQLGFIKHLQNATKWSNILSRIERRGRPQKLQKKNNFWWFFAAAANLQLQCKKIQYCARFTFLCSQEPLTYLKIQWFTTFDKVKLGQPLLSLNRKVVPLRNAIPDKI